MYILLAAATTFEIQPTIEALYGEQGYRIGEPGRVAGHHIEPLITGVGGVATSYSLMRQIGKGRPDLIIQAGIAGCLTGKQPGEVLAVSEDELADIGVWEEGRFKSLFEMKLADGDGFPFSRGLLVNPYRRLLALTGLESIGALTVNEITTDAERIRWYQQNTTAVVESMEGGPLHYVCLQEGIPFLQLRSVSNTVGIRDKTKWDIRSAIARLNAQLGLLLERPELNEDILSQN